ncbi:MAG: cytochrome c oxidase subunit I [Chloroflexota bacterium]|nr:cytochrome c oxidase subunit I [Chloroflexota bacterium]
MLDRLRLALRQPTRGDGVSPGLVPVAAAAASRQLRDLWESLPNELGWIGTVDHKRIGTRYIVTGFVFFVLGGVEALALRAQLARPENSLLDPTTYNELFTMHGTTMIFLFATPLLSGFGNYFVPLMIGARDMAFPRLNALGYWIYVLAGAFMYSSFLASAVPQGGWFAYVPLTGRAYSPEAGMDFWTLGVIFIGLSSTAGAINFIVTIFKFRAPGMALSRMPLFVWNILVTAFGLLFAIPSLTVAAALLELDRQIGTHVFDPAGGGNPLLWQHLFWIFGHPDVYIIFMPAVGLVSTMVPVFTRHTMVGYLWVAVAAVTTIIFSFGIWVHHMFATGLPPLALSIFSAASIMIAVPAGLQVIAWIVTIFVGRPVWKTPFLFVIGFLVLFLVGGLTGVMVAAVPFNWQVTDSYFIVAHFHYVLFGGSVFPIFGAFYYWLPKMTGRLLDERLGVLNFWLMFVGFNLAFLPMFLAGMLGEPRRTYTYPSGMGLDEVNFAETIGAFLLALGIVVFIVNVLWSERRGALAGDDPWQANTLEWATSSPPPPYNFARIPTVYSRDPLWDPTPESTTIKEPEALRLTRRETLASSLMDARPELLVQVPADSIWPAFVALAIGVLFLGALVGSITLAGFGALGLFLSISGWLWPARRPL